MIMEVFHMREWLFLFFKFNIFFLNIYIKIFNKLRFCIIFLSTPNKSYQAKNYYKNQKKLFHICFLYNIAYVTLYPTTAIIFRPFLNKCNLLSFILQ